MSAYKPETPEGVDVHQCENCRGDGYVVDISIVDGKPIEDEYECPECDGTGEWFE